VTDVSDGFPLKKLPKELRCAIYEAVYENTLAHHTIEAVQIRGSGFVALQSLLRASREIRHEVQEVLQKRMGRQVTFRATCNNIMDVKEALKWAKIAFRGNVPSDRRVSVIFKRPAQGSKRPVRPGTNCTCFKDIVVWRKLDFENEAWCTATKQEHPRIESRVIYRSFVS
jgi:hypothetical protein